MIHKRIKIRGGILPDTPGVYFYKDTAGKILYIGKATSLKRRVHSYFNRPQNDRIENMLRDAVEIEYIKKPTAIEALILEANLIKQYMPAYNILGKDNKSFLYLVFTKEDFPKPIFIRGADMPDNASKIYKKVFGPYTSPRSARSALDLVRRVFPWSTCERPTSDVRSRKTGKKPRACFYCHLKLCPGVCIGAISKREYGKIIRDLIKFFEGKKDEILKAYKKEMKIASKEERFEEAGELRKKIYFLEHIRDIAILKNEDLGRGTQDEGSLTDQSGRIFGRVEGYDISNISGTSTVASMVVFENGAPAKAEYRKFKMKSVVGSNDVASIRETLERRFKNEWRLPDMILIDGGKPQVNVARAVVSEVGLGIPVVGLAKGAERKKNELICSDLEESFCEMCRKHIDILIAVRDEAHRFAVKYHRKVRGGRLSSS
ncbi:MAG: GIY-YIG nuclease family protein [bacterium]|nr:GIY-YIG nuclease family protein [bacterium]